MLSYRKLLALALVICLVAGTVGCGNGAGPSGEDAGTDPTHFYEEVRENFLIDAEVVSFPTRALKVYEAVPLTITEDQIVDFLAANGDPLTEWTDSGIADRLTGNTEKDGSFRYNLTRTGPCFFVYDNALYDWWGNYHIYGGQCHYDDSAQFVFAHMFLEPKDFEFATAQEAEENVRSLLSILGLHDLVLNRTLYVDHQGLSDITPILRLPENQPIKGGTNPTKDDWSEADDGYLFEFFAGIDGVPMIYNEITYDTYAYHGCDILVSYQASGVISLSLNACWLKGDVVEEAEQCITATEALNLARVKLENDRAYDSGTIIKVSGEYMYVQEGDRYLLRPVWGVCASYTSQYLPDYPIRKYVYIDAITGEEI